MGAVTGGTGLHSDRQLGSSSSSLYSIHPLLFLHLFLHHFLHLVVHLVLHLGLFLIAESVIGHEAPINKKQTYIHI